jgi:hypothetical protein
MASFISSVVPLMSPEKPGAERTGQRARIDRGVGVAVGGRLRLVAERRGRTGLPLGQTVDLVVHHEIGDVGVAPRGVHEVIAADGDAVAVAAHRDHREVGSGQLDAGGDGERTSVQRIDAVRLHVAG